MAGQEKEILKEEIAPETPDKAAGNPEDMAGSEETVKTTVKDGEQAEAGVKENPEGEPEAAEGEPEAAEGEPEAEEEPEAQGGEEDSSQTADAKDAGEKKSFFRKKKDKKDEQIEELNDRIKRQMAEFDNFRKRTEKEKSAMFEIGAKSVLEKLLPIVDNFERGLSSLEEEKKQEPFPVGMEKTYQLLVKMLEDMEVKPIEAVGSEFDPNLHNAVMHVEDEEAGDNVILEEFQKGYTFRDSVLRVSMVKVAN